jgi:hypothetical protein
MAKRRLPNNCYKLEGQTKHSCHRYAINNDGKDVQKPRTKFRQDEIISIPSVVTGYNSNMGGVYHNDQHRAYYTLQSVALVGAGGNTSSGDY